MLLWRNWAEGEWVAAEWPVRAVLTGLHVLTVDTEKVSRSTGYFGCGAGCVGSEREESGRFVRDLLLAKSPALQNMWHFWALSILCPLWFRTPLVPHFGSVFSLSCLLLPPPFSIASVPSWFSSLFSAPDFLYFFLLTRKIHCSYLSAHN